MTKSLNYASSNPQKNSPNIVWERLIFAFFQDIARNASSFSVKQYEACRSADDNHLYGVYLEKLCAHKRCHKQEYAYVELPRINAWRAEVFGGHEY